MTIAGTPTILVAAADADTRALYRTVFEPLGYRISETADGRDAMIAALTNTPGLLLTELALPNVNGIELCRILRQDPTTRHVPIVAVTADARASVLTDIRRAGADAVFVKPVALDALCATVSQLYVPHVRADGEGAPIVVHCPQCNRVLDHRSTHTGGIGLTEQWDYFRCPGCHREFQYRHRTRKLRPAL